MALLPTSTLAALEEQQRQLQKGTSLIQDQIDRIHSTEQSVAFQAGILSKATDAAQAILSRPHFPEAYEMSGDPLKELEQLVQLAEQVQTGSAQRKIQGHIAELNEAVGKTEALAVCLEQEVAGLDQTITALQRRIQERRETVNLAKNLGNP